MRKRGEIDSTWWEQVELAESLFGDNERDYLIEETTKTKHETQQR